MNKNFRARPTVRDAKQHYFLAGNSKRFVRYHST